MIQKLNEDIICSSSIVYKTNYEQVLLVFKQNPQLAGELSLSILELLFTGQASSDDITVQLALKNLEVISEKNRKNYERKLAAGERRSEEFKKAREELLITIADLYNEGLNQKQIAEKLGYSEGTISKKMIIIRSDYPQLLTRK